jgi:hypothetical protein
VSLPAGEPRDVVEEGNHPGARLPPVAEIATVSLALIVAGGIYMAANVQRPASLSPAIGLLASAAALTLVGLALLVRVQRFAWPRFWQVGRWTLLVYTISAGMIGYVFALDHTPGKQLALITAMLVVFALDIPVIIAFTVARYQTA